MRPLIDPAHGPMTPAERQRRHRAKIGRAAVNRQQRRKGREKRAALRRVERETKAATRERKAATERDAHRATIAALSATIRQLADAATPRRGVRNGTLDSYTVATIELAQALPLILQHEWLGNIGKARIFVGLYSPQRDYRGVACFGHGPAGTIRQRIGSPAMCLERGACTPDAPENAASFLINAACRLVLRLPM